MRVSGTVEAEAVFAWCPIAGSGRDRNVDERPGDTSGFPPFMMDTKLERPGFEILTKGPLVGQHG